MLIVIMLSVMFPIVILSVAVLNAIMLRVTLELFYCAEYLLKQCHFVIVNRDGL
jgi:hypothetical protein